MLVKWKGEGIVSVKPIGPEVTDPAAANLIEAVLIYPGWNDIADNIWENCKPHMVNYFTAGLLEELNKKEKDEAGNDVYVGILFSSIAGRNPNEAANMVKECYVDKTLQEWEKQTGRADILYVIRRQREKIAKGYDDEEELD